MVIVAPTRRFDYAQVFNKKAKEYKLGDKDAEANGKEENSITPMSPFIRTFSAHSSKVHSVNWSCDGAYLGTGSVDKTAALLKLQQGSTKMVKVYSCRGHTGNVDQVAFSPIHPELLATAGHDKTVRLWDSRVEDSGPAEVIEIMDTSTSAPDSKRSKSKSREGTPANKDKSDKNINDGSIPRTPTHTVATKGENINLTWSPNGKYCCVGNKDDLLSWIDMEQNPPRIVKSAKFACEVNEFSWNHTGQLFVITTGNGTLQTYDWNAFLKSADDGNPDGGIDKFNLDTLEAHSSNCICLKFDPNGKYFAVGSNDALASLWDANSMIPIRTYSELAWPVRTLSFSHDSRLLASASEDSFIDISLVEPIPGELDYSEQAEDYTYKMDIGQSEYGDEFMLHTPLYQANRRSTSNVFKVETGLPTFTVAWHPKSCLLAYACEEERSERRRDKDKENQQGNIRIFGVEETQ